MKTIANPQAILAYAKAPVQIVEATRMLCRWVKAVRKGRIIDRAELCSQIEELNSVEKVAGVDESLLARIKYCGYVMSTRHEKYFLLTYLEETVSMICQHYKSSSMKKVQKHYADQGMSERYEPLQKRLRKEAIKKLGGKSVNLVNRHVDDSKSFKLVRRIVEKRAAQDVFRGKRNRNSYSGAVRQIIRRAVSFNMASLQYAEFDFQARMDRSHYKVVATPHPYRRMRAKFGYKTYEEAVAGCRRYEAIHPDSVTPVEPYRCKECGHWHIGHNYGAHTTAEAC